MQDDDRPPKLSASNDELLLLAIRIVCLGFLGYWSLILIRPFLTIIVWSIIIAVAGCHDAMAIEFGREPIEYWVERDTTTAVLFTLYMVPVNLLDNVLRPLLANGLSTPMPVILIGVLGGTLVHGVIGLFVGPIVLSIGWQLLVVWTRDQPKATEVAG